MRWCWALVVSLLILVACSRPVPVGNEAGAPASGGSPPASSQPEVIGVSSELPLGRAVVREAEVTLECTDYRSVGEALQRLVENYGGYVSESDFVDIEQETRPRQVSEIRQMTLKVHVPNARLQAFLDAARRVDGVVRVMSETLRSQDVTEETIDLAARRRSLEATEARLRELLGRAQTVDEALRVEQALRDVRTEIERIEGRERVLRERTEMAEVRFILVPFVPPQDGSLRQTFEEAWRVSLVLLRWAVHGLVWGLVVTWWIWSTLLLAGMGVAVVLRRLRRRMTATT